MAAQMGTELMWSLFLFNAGFYFPTFHPFQYFYLKIFMGEVVNISHTPSVFGFSTLVLSCLLVEIFSETLKSLLPLFPPALLHISHSFSHPQPVPCSVSFLFLLCLPESVKRNLCTCQKSTSTPAIWDTSARAKESSLLLIFRNKQQGGTAEPAWAQSFACFFFLRHRGCYKCLFIHLTICVQQKKINKRVEWSKA